MRDPEADDLFWVNPAGVPFSLTRASDILLLNREGEVFEGERTAQGYQSQFEIHDARPELRAAVHAHSFYGFAWSSAGGLLDALTTDSAGLRSIQAYRDSFDVPVTVALGSTARLLIQKHHGFIAAGETIAEAAWYFLNAERAAQTQLLLQAAGRLDAVPDHLATKWTFSPDIARRQFELSILEEVELHPSVAE